jgi:hypothetical protein
VLVHQHALSQADVPRLVDEQRRSGLRLGTYLRRAGIVPDGEVLRALATQSRIRYLAHVEGTGLPSAPGGLTRSTVQALGVVPFAADAARRTLHVACTAPLPRLALAALEHLTGWRAESFMVLDELLPDLAAQYGRPPHVAVGLEASGAIDTAARRIAQAASRGDITRIAHARCDHHVWVRLEGTRGTEDLLLPIAAQSNRREEEECPAAPMSH